MFDQTLLYLLRKSYAIIYQLLLTSEPVSEALLPIYNQLTTLRKCLLEVKKLGGVSSPRELYPYSMKVCEVTEFLFTSSELISGSSIRSTTCAWMESSWSAMRFQMDKGA